MSTDLLRPPATLTPSEALRRSQQAPALLTQSSYFQGTPWPLSLLTTSDAPEKWTIYENLFYSCIRTGDNQSAFMCLERLKERFGEHNERVMGLMGIYHEAAAPSKAALENFAGQFQEIVEERPTNMVMRKRRIALLRSLGKTTEAVAALVELVDVSPTDAEAWSELADLYLLQGMYAQAIYSLEEVLLTIPNAWNMHARLGEALYIAASASSGDGIRLLTRSMKTFCRSIELCDDYLRGFYGLKLTTTKLKVGLSKANTETIKEVAKEDGYQAPPLSTVQRLNELATKKLAEIIRKSSTNEAGWGGYSEAEVIAARELLDRDSANVAR